MSARQLAVADQASLLAAGYRVNCGAMPRRAVRAARAARPSPQAIRDARAVHDHLEWMGLRGLSRQTIDARRRLLARMRAELGTLLGADEAALRAWRAGLQVRPEGVVIYVTHARQFYAWAAAEGLIPVSPAARLTIPRRRLRLPRPIAEEDLMAALAEAPPRVRPWLVLAGWAGLRAQEIARLRREDIRETHRPPVLLVTALAAKGGLERVVPLSPFVVAELSGAGLPAVGWVFPRRDGQGGPNEPHAISHLANTALHEAGVTATLHQLRHRFATQLYRQSHDLRLVQDLLGHVNLHTTAGYAAWDRAEGPPAVGGIPVPASP